MGEDGQGGGVEEGGWIVSVQGIGGGVLLAVIMAIYAIVIGLSILVLYRLIFLIPALTRLAITTNRFLRDHLHEGNRPLERRLLDLEDQLRLKNITPEEYEAKRQEILKDL